jgi:hypothetical protein
MVVELKTSVRLMRRSFCGQRIGSRIAGSLVVVLSLAGACCGTAQSASVELPTKPTVASSPGERAMKSPNVSRRLGAMRISEISQRAIICSDPDYKKAMTDLLARNPSQEAALASQRKDFSVMGYKSWTRIDSLGTDCPTMRRSRYREIFGSDSDGISPCLDRYLVIAKPFVELYNRALGFHAATLGINLCAPGSETLK